VHDPFARRRLLRLPGEELCDEAQGDAVDRYLARFAAQVDGGAREAASSRERLRLCAAQRAKLAADVRAVFRGK